MPVPVQAGPRVLLPSRADVARVLAEPGRVRTWFQPIVDTATGRAAGWEALSRFTDADGSRSRWGPAEWFAAAQGSDLGADLEAHALRLALGSLDRLPADTFLTVNVSPAAIAGPQVRDALAERGDLSRVIVEVTETEAVHDVPLVASVCAGIRSAGGLVAVDDAGSGYAGLALIAALRPQLVKVDRELIRDCHTDPVKLSLVEVLGVWAAGMDAWLLAEGVETSDEYAAVVGLGVPLVQGYLTGRPAADPLGPDGEVLRRLTAEHSRVALRDSVASLVQAWPVVALDGVDVGPGGVPSPRGAAETVTGPRVLLQAGRPVAVVHDAADGRRTSPVSLRVHPSETVAEALRRAMGREVGCRFDPVLVTDPQGRVVGVVPVEMLVGRVLSDPQG